MNNALLSQLIYVSRIGADIRANIIHEFRSILTESQKYNTENDITGFLVFDSTVFFQVLEGDRNALWDLFLIIQRDRRHVNVRLIEFSALEQRKFSDWSMGGCLRTTITDDIFLRYGFLGPIEASAVKPERLVALAHDLMVSNQLSPR